MIVTPGQLTHRAEFYHQLHQLTAAGVGILRALQQLERHPPARSYRPRVAGVLRDLEKGYTLSESLRRAQGWLPEFDLTLIEAGERSGRLDQCFRLLAQHYTERATMTRRFLSDLLYPVFLFHMLVFVSALVLFFWKPGLALLPFGALAVVYILAVVAVFAAQNKHGEQWRGWIESALHPVPVLGTARRDLALSRLAAALESLISAGVSIVEAWELAAAASGSVALRRAVTGWRPRLHAGSTPAELVSATEGFPDLFSNQYATGEISGRLDETLRRLHLYYQEEGSRKMSAVSRWVPIGIYLIVAVAVALFVLWFWTSYYGQMLGRF